MNVAGIVLFLAAMILSMLVYLLKYDELWVWYAVYKEKLYEVEQYIESLGISISFVIAMLVMFTVRSFIPFLSISAVCVLTGAVLPSYWAILVNMVGITIMMTVKYFWGKFRGSGNAWRLVTKNEKVRGILESSGNANKWLLVVLRLVPMFSVNGVSKVYGSIGFKFWEFLLLSVAGYFPKLISYTIIGRNVYDPLSPKFLVPLILMLLLSSFSLLSINAIWTFVAKNIHIRKNLHSFADSLKGIIKKAKAEHHT